MITITTETLCFSLPDRILPRQSLTSAEASTLDLIRLRRLRFIVNGWLSKGMDPAEAQAHLDHLASTYEFASRPSMPDAQDPVDLEAMSIARELVRRKIAARGLDLSPASLETHALQIAKLPRVRERAQVIVRARRNAAQSLIPT